VATCGVEHLHCAIYILSTPCWVVRGVATTLA
jgi:hypothetical protein